ncbi:hypothetical protein [Streptomyces sp. NPDC058731]|uniref:hypothetical protein n=1 Tax=Streptomyces sp. NPDC058731 TaxID=3346613 RepID=UPI0036C7EA49
MRALIPVTSAPSSLGLRLDLVGPSRRVGRPAPGEFHESRGLTPAPGTGRV